MRCRRRVSASALIGRRSLDLHVGQPVDPPLAAFAHLDPALVVLHEVQELADQLQRGVGDLERLAVEQHRAVARAR